MSDSISVRGFARKIGKNHVWVLRRIEDGTIPRNPDKTIPLRAGLEAAKKLLQNEADAIAKSSKSVDSIELFNDARARKEDALASIKKIELEQLEGSVITVAEAEDDARLVASKLRQFCIAMPTRYAGLLENRSQREAEGVLQDIANELLEAIHGGRFLTEDDGDDEE